MKRSSAHQMIIVSSDKSDTPVDIAEKLQKAVSTLKQQQESKQLPDKFLAEQHHLAAGIVNQVVTNMLEEIVKVIVTIGGESSA